MMGTRMPQNRVLTWEDGRREAKAVVLLRDAVTRDYSAGSASSKS